MNTARFNFVAQRMEPKHTITSVDWRPDGQTIGLACGHSLEYVAHCHVKVGWTASCTECGRAAARKLPEFRVVAAFDGKPVGDLREPASPHGPE